MNRLTMFLLATTAALPLLTAAPASAQSPPDTSEAALMRILIEELRALRLTLQQNALLDLRSRLLIDRARIQSQLVGELQREVEQRTMNRSMMIDEEPFEPMFEQLDEQLRVTSDAAERRRIEAEIDAMKKRREIFGRHQERMLEHEQQMELRLAEERRRLDEIQRDLMNLEASMTRPPE